MILQFVNESICHLCTHINTIDTSDRNRMFLSTFSSSSSSFPPASQHTHVCATIRKIPTLISEHSPITGCACVFLSRARIHSLSRSSISNYILQTLTFLSIFSCHWLNKDRRGKNRCGKIVVQNCLAIGIDFGW